MKFNISEIELSKSDVNRKVSLPCFLSEELAEFIGIMIGDGNINSRYGKNSNGSKSLKSDIRISGNKKEEKYLRYVMTLFHSLFNLKMRYKQDTAQNAAVLKAHSKGIVQYLHKICEIPVNKKSDIVFIPEIIKKANTSIKCAFLRGLADTDFTVTFKNRTNKGHNYPVIKGSFKSKFLIEDLEVLYSELGFRYCVVYGERGFDKRINKYDIRHCIYLNGHENFEKWLSFVGFSNTKFHRKIEKFQKDRNCPPGY